MSFQFTGWIFSVLMVFQSVFLTFDTHGTEVSYVDSLIRFNKVMFDSDYVDSKKKKELMDPWFLI